MPDSVSPDDYARHLERELQGVPDLTPEQAAILALLDRIEALELDVGSLRQRPTIALWSCHPRAQLVVAECREVPYPHRKGGGL